MASTSKPRGRESSRARAHKQNMASTLKQTGRQEASLPENRLLGKKDDDWRYTPLLKAALTGNWDAAKKFFEQDEAATDEFILKFRELTQYLNVVMADTSEQRRTKEPMDSNVAASTGTSRSTSRSTSPFTGMCRDAAAIGKMICNINAVMADTSEQRRIKGSNTHDGDDGEKKASREEKEQWLRYNPLVKVTLRGDWKTAKIIFELDTSALTATVDDLKNTVLHIAVGTGEKNIHFVEELVKLMPVAALSATNYDDRTALHIAARVGNTKAVKILVGKHPPLLDILRNRIGSPIYNAALSARRETVEYLLEVTKDNDQVIFSGQSGAFIMWSLISSNFFDIALDLVERHPHLATLTTNDGDSALEWMAIKVSAFRSGSRLNFWQLKIYDHLSVTLEKRSILDKNKANDVENPPNNTQEGSQSSRENTSKKSVRQKLQDILWKVLELSVPQIKHIRKEKQIHAQALQLVKTLCEKITRLNDLEVYNNVVCEGMIVAVQTGIPEIIEAIVDWFPSLAYPGKSNLFPEAIIRRHEKVFNLIYQMSDLRHLTTFVNDKSDNTLLHLAGRLSPLNKLSQVTGAALQMQRELQWFEEVKKFVNPIFWEYKNKNGETPEMIFTREHKDLVVQGEKWMRDTANSCMITAALIVTVAFAAAITVPGGHKGDTGVPNFTRQTAFVIFTVLNAISLFASATSLLVFLSVLTSRYAERDFLSVLPMRLILGLVTLFLSITTMMVAFSSTLYLVFGQNKAWILIPVAALTCFPITSFVTLQFPLLATLISSTCGKGVFGKQSERPFY